MGLLASYRTGALNQAVKTNPLPPGYYWIDIFDSNERPASIATFNDWVALHSTTVTVRRTEEYDTTGDDWDWWNPWGIGQGGFSKKNAGEWVLFEVLQPTPWGLEIQLGYPNEGQSNMTSQDTVQKPDPEPLLPPASEWPSWVPWAIGGGVAVVGLVIYASIRR